jgi:hypothetical protein
VPRNLLRGLSTMKLRCRLVLVLGLVGLLCSWSAAVASQVWYVNQNVTGGTNTGQYWANAFVELQSALVAAQAGDEIWVAAGAYLPDFNPATGAHSGQRASSFRLVQPVSLYGGFAGSETLRTQRQLGRNTTILSGDIGQTGNNSDNCYHVLTAVGVAGLSVVDGFTVKAGRADAATEPDCNGGGVYADRSGLSLVRCTFLDNYAGQRGGAIYNLAGGPSVTLCVFNGNHAAQEGGAVFNRQTTASVFNCLFKENTADVFGGAITSFDSTLNMINCTLKDNSAAFFGGAVANNGSQATVINSVLWSNTPDQIMSFEPDSEVIWYSCVQGGLDDGSNTSSDPLFSGDRLSPESPAIDAGDSGSVPAGLTTDLDGRPRIYDGNGDSWTAVDMGAYEFTDQQPTLRLTSPNGGETLTTGEEFSVKWQGTGLAGHGVLALIKGETFLGNVGTAPSNTGTLSWRPSLSLSEAADYRLRLTWYLDTGEELIDTSDRLFAIVRSKKPSLILVSPNGGETFTAGTDHTIVWQGANLTGHGLFSLRKGTTTIDNFAWIYDNSTSAPWQICPYAPDGTDYYIDAYWYLDDGSMLVDSSDAPFTITGSRPKRSVTLTAPNGGEVWQAGQTVAVTWTSLNAAGDVGLSLYKGTQWVTTRYPIPMSAGSYEWGPLCDRLVEGTDYRLVVYWSDCDQFKTESSDATFTVQNSRPPASIQLTSPNGGETIQAGGVYPITWTGTSLDKTVSLSLYRGGKYVQTIGQANAASGRYDWSVCPNLRDGSDYSIRLQLAGCGPIVEDGSDSTFGIVGSTQPAFSVTSPIQGETLQAGAVVSISWSSTGQHELVTVELYKGSDRYLEISRAMMADQQVPWWVCPTLPEGDDYSVVLTSKDCSDEPLTVASEQFSIVGTTQSTLTVTSPNGGETIDLSQPLRVTWTSTNPQGYVSIELCRNGVPISTIGYASMSSGSSMCYDLCPSIPAGDGYTVHVIQDNQCWNPASDSSDGPVTVVGSSLPPMIHLLSPNGGEILEAGKSYDVTWESTGAFYTVDIWLEREGLYTSGVTYEQISSNSVRMYLCSDLNDGTDYLLRISAWSCLGEVRDESDGLLTIAGSQPPPKVSITAPPAGTVIKAGEPVTVTWTGNGIDGTVDAGLYRDGNERFSFRSVHASQGSLTEQICEYLPEGEYEIRLRVLGCAKSTSDPIEVPVTVAGTWPEPELSLISPAGGEVLQPGATHTIRWTVTNPLGVVSIHLYKGEFHGSQEIGQAPMSAGQFIWKIDEFQEPGGDYTMQIGRPLCSGSIQSHSGSFAIANTGPPVPSLTLLSPNGGEVLEAGSTQTITWASNNPSGYVTIDLLQDGSYSQRLGNVPMVDGRFTWNVCPVGEDRANYSIRIGWGKYGGASIIDDSDGVFQIVNHSPRMSLVANTDLAGQTIQAGTVRQITWTVENPQGDLLIQLQRNYWPIAVLGTVPQAAGQFDWHVCPMFENSNDYSIQLGGLDCSLDGYSLLWTSGRFSIVGQQAPLQVSVTAPAGGETWPKGSTQIITWTTADPDIDGVADIELESVAEEVFVQMGYANLSDRRFEWTVPESLVAGADYRIRLVPKLCGSREPSSAAIYSSGRFTITGPAVPFLDPYVTILAPRSGDDLVAGTNTRIIWTTDLPLGDVDAYLRADSAGSFGVRYVGTVPLSQGFLDWQIDPCWVRDDTTTYRIELVGLGLYGASASGFTILRGPKAQTDFDGDCDADGDDIKALEGCASGPGVPVQPGCENKDLDHDNDVDQADFGLLQACLTGPDVPADPGCLNR